MSESKARMAGEISRLHAELFQTRRLVYDIVEEINEQRDEHPGVWPFKVNPPVWFSSWV